MGSIALEEPGFEREIADHAEAVCQGKLSGILLRNLGWKAWPTNSATFLHSGTSPARNRISESQDIKSAPFLLYLLVPGRPGFPVCNGLVRLIRVMPLKKPRLCADRLLPFNSVTDFLP